MIRQLFIIVMVFFSVILHAQRSLQLLKVKSNSVKKYELYINDELEYKLKGQHRYRHGKIVNLQDSVIVLANDSVILLNKIKAIRLRDYHHLMKLFGTAMKTLGVGFIALNTINNAIYDRDPLIPGKAVKISAALFGTGVLMNYLSSKHFRINHRKTLKITDQDYKNLNERKTD